MGDFLHVDLDLSVDFTLRVQNLPAEGRTVVEDVFTCLGHSYRLAGFLVPADQSSWAVEGFGFFISYLLFNNNS